MSDDEKKSNVCDDEHGSDVEDAPKGPEDINKDGSVIKEILTKGTGWKTPKNGAKVFVHYTGTLLDGTEFDSSRSRAVPFEFTLGRGVITGWSEGVATMKKGERAKFTIKPEKAYGAAGSPPKIPPHAPLVFDIELLDWNELTEVTKDKGIQKLVLKESDDYKKPEDQSVVTCNYTLRLPGTEEEHPNGEIVSQGENVSWTVDEDGEPLKLEAFDTIVKTMKQSEKIIAYINKQYGFGEKGKTEGTLVAVPPNSDLVLEIELLEFKKEQEHWNMTPEEKLAAAEKKRIEGNEWFKKGNVARAIRRYEKSKNILSSDHTFDDNQKNKAKSLRVPIHLNLAQCYLNQKKYKDCIVQCDSALEIERKNVKALFRRGKALNESNDWDRAIVDLKAAFELDPNDANIKKELITAQNKKKQQDLKDKKKFSGMFDKLTGFASEGREVKPDNKNEEDLDMEDD